MNRIEIDNHKRNTEYLLNHREYFDYRMEKYGDSREYVIDEIKNCKDWDTIEFVVSFIRKYGLEEYKKVTSSIY